MVVLIMLIGAGLVYWAVGQLYARYWNKGLSVEIRFSSDHAVKQKISATAVYLCEISDG